MEAHILSNMDVSMQIAEAYDRSVRDLSKAPYNTMTVEEMSNFVNENVHIVSDRYARVITKTVVDEWVKRGRKEPVYILYTISYADLVEPSGTIEGKGIFMDKEYFQVAIEGAFSSYAKKLVSASRGTQIQGYVSIMILLSPKGDVKRFCNIVHDVSGECVRMNREDTNRLYKHLMKTDKDMPDSLFDMITSEEGKAYLSSIDTLVSAREEYEMQSKIMLSMRSCAYTKCNIRAPKLSCCPCKMAYYCCKEHQVLDWKRHKKEECKYKK